MSDFLSGLVERSLAATGTVRPQSPSIFAPRLVNGRAGFPGAENPAPRALDQANPQSAARVSRVQSLWRTDPEPSPQFVTARSNPGVPSREVVELPDTVREGLACRNPPEMQQSEPRSPASERTVDAATTNEKNKEASRTELSKASAPIRPRLDLPEQRLPVTPKKEIHERADAAKIDKADGRASPPQSPSEQTPAISRAKKSVFPDSTWNPPCETRAGKIIEKITPERDAHRELARARDAQAVSPRPSSLRPPVLMPQPKSSAAAPSINVTIGRIEVRATLPPAPAKTPGPAAPILSLDEYLRQRAGGDRR
jgi:hypothetical protein